jgi:hypothetical protein
MPRFTFAILMLACFAVGYTLGGGERLLALLP